MVFLAEPSSGILTYVITALVGLVVAQGGAIVYLFKRKAAANGPKPDIQLQVANAMRVEVDKENLATVILTSKEHTLQITALRRDVDALKQK